MCDLELFKYDVGWGWHKFDLSGFPNADGFFTQNPKCITPQKKKSHFERREKSDIQIYTLILYNSRYFALWLTNPIHD